MAPASAGRPDEAQEPRSKAVIELLCANPGAPRVSSHQICRFLGYSGRRACLCGSAVSALIQIHKVGGARDPEP